MRLGHNASEAGVNAMANLAAALASALTARCRRRPLLELATDTVAVLSVNALTLDLDAMLMGDAPAAPLAEKVIEAVRADWWRRMPGFPKRRHAASRTC